MLLQTRIHLFFSTRFVLVFYVPILEMTLCHSSRGINAGKQRQQVRDEFHSTYLN